MGNGGIHDPSEQCNRLGDGHYKLKARTLLSDRVGRLTAEAVRLPA